MTSHELAKALLIMPDLPVVSQNGCYLSYWTEISKPDFLPKESSWFDINGDYHEAAENSVISV
jgi:hypothetical protein